MKFKEPKEYNFQLKDINNSSIIILKNLINKYKGKSSTCFDLYKSDYNEKVNCILTYEEQFKQKFDFFIFQVEQTRLEFDLCVKKTGASQSQQPNVVQECLREVEIKIYKLNFDILS
jgi:hypothetical protein